MITPEGEVINGELDKALEEVMEFLLKAKSKEKKAGEVLDFTFMNVYLELKIK